MITVNNSLAKFFTAATAVTTHTQSFTVNSGSNIGLFVKAERNQGVTGITYNGAALTYNVATDSYFLANPTIGTADIVITGGSSSTGDMAIMSALALNGVNISSPYNLTVAQGGCNSTGQPNSWGDVDIQMFTFIDTVTPTFLVKNIVYPGMNYDIDTTITGNATFCNTTTTGAFIDPSLLSNDRFPLTSGYAGQTSNAGIHLSGSSINPAILSKTAMSPINAVAGGTNTMQVYGVLAAPSLTTTTGASSSVTSSTVTLAGSYNDASETGVAIQFAYSTDPSVSTGRQLAIATTTTGTNTSTPVTANLTGLTPSTTYYYRLEAFRASPLIDDKTAAILSFTTSAAPTTTTVNITGATCPLNYPVTFNSNSYATEALFVNAVQSAYPTFTITYNSGACNFSFTGTTTPPSSISITETPDPVVPLVSTINCASIANITKISADISVIFNGQGNESSLGSGTVIAYIQYSTSAGFPNPIQQPVAQSIPNTGNQTINTTLTGLLPNTTYYYRGRIVSSSPTSQEVFSNVCSFTTLPSQIPAISATCINPTNMTNTSATLNSSINSNGLSTTYYFSYSTTSSGTYTDLITQTTTGNGPVSSPITGLASNTTYFYKVTATNTDGSVTSAVCEFKTDPASEVTCRSPQTVATVDPILNVTETWCNPSAILTNTNKTSCSEKGKVSAIEVSNFNFGIGANDIVTGLGVKIKIKKADVSTNPNVTVYLVENISGAKVYHNIGVINTLLTTFQEFTFGGVGSLFGFPVLPNIINNLNLAFVSDEKVCAESVSACVYHRCPEDVSVVTGTGCVGWAQVQPSKAIRKIDINDMEIMLASFNRIADNQGVTSTLTMNETGGKYFYWTQNQGTDKEEVFKITAIQPQINGNVKLIVGARGIKLTRPTIDQSNVLTDPKLRKAHQSGSTGVISNPAVFYDDYARCYACSNDCSWTVPNADLTNRGMVEIATACEAISGATNSDSGAPLVVTPATNFASKYLGAYDALGTTHTSSNTALQGCTIPAGSSFDVTFTSPVLTGDKWNFNGVDYGLCDQGNSIITGQVPINKTTRLVYNGSCMIVENPVPVIAGVVAGHQIATINGTSINETNTTLSLVNGELVYGNESANNPSIPLLSNDAGQIGKVGTDGKLLIKASACNASYTGEFSDTNTQAITWINGGNGVGNFTVGTITIPTPPVAPEAGYKWVLGLKAYAGMTATDPTQRARLALHADVSHATGSYIVIDDFDNYVDNFPVSTGQPVYSRRKSIHSLARPMSQTSTTTVTLKLFITTSFVPDPNNWASNQNLIPFDDGAPTWYIEYYAHQVLI